jgi:hypothetical protein
MVRKRNLPVCAACPNQLLYTKLDGSSGDVVDNTRLWGASAVTQFSQVGGCTTFDTRRVLAELATTPVRSPLFFRPSPVPSALF